MTDPETRAALAARDQSYRDADPTPEQMARLTAAVLNFDDTPCSDESCLHGKDEHDLEDGTCWGENTEHDNSPEPQCVCPRWRDPHDEAREQGQRWADQDRDNR